MEKKVFVAALIKVEQKQEETFEQFIRRLREEMRVKLATNQLSLMVV